VGGGEGDPLSIQVSDLKPGDSGEGEFCFSIVDNPAYMWMCGAVTENNEKNGQSEPEMDADTTGGDPGEGMGELADAMQVTVSYCTGRRRIRSRRGDRFRLAGGRDERARQRHPLSGDGDAEAPGRRPRAPFEGVDSAFVNETEVNAAEQCVCFEWEVPFDVGNEIQTDSVAFDFEFYAVQSRHNDGSANPVSPPVRSRASASRTTSRTPTCCGPPSATAAPTPSS